MVVFIGYTRLLFVPRQRGGIVFSIPFVLPLPPLQVVGTLCWQLLLQFYAYTFETLHVFRPLSELVHIVWI